MSVRVRGDGLENIVAGVAWRLTATDGPYSVFAAGYTELGPADPDSFIAFTQVTREMALAWCEPVAIANGVIDRLTADLAALAAPPDIVSLPPPFGG